MMASDSEFAMLLARVTMLEREIHALKRRNGAPFMLARSTLPVDDTGVVQKGQAQLDALSTRSSIPLLYNFGFTSSPPVDADFHIAFLDGDRSRAVVIASGHQTYRLKGLGVGDCALYDTRGAYLRLASAGPQVNCAGNPMTITGDLHVTGAIVAGFGGSDQVGVQTHRHGTGSAAAGTVAPTAGS